MTGRTYIPIWSVNLSYGIFFFANIFGLLHKKSTKAINNRGCQLDDTGPTLFPKWTCKLEEMSKDGPQIFTTLHFKFTKLRPL